MINIYNNQPAPDTVTAAHDHPDPLVSAYPPARERVRMIAKIALATPSNTETT